MKVTWEAGNGENRRRYAGTLVGVVADMEHRASLVIAVEGGTFTTVPYHSASWSAEDDPPERDRERTAER